MDRRQFLKNSTAAARGRRRGAPPMAARAGAGWPDQDRPAGAAHRRGRVRRPGDGRGHAVLSRSDERARLPAARSNCVIEDDASNPDTSLQKARRLVEQGNCHMLIGDLLANTGLAVANYVKGTGTPYFIPIIAADDLTQRAPHQERDPRRRLFRQRLHPSVRRLGPQAGLQEDRDDQPGLYVRPRAVRRPRPGVHRRRRRDRAAILASAEHRRLQPLSRPARRPEGRCRCSPWRTGADATRLIQQYASFGLKGQIAADWAR